MSVNVKLDVRGCKGITCILMLSRLQTLLGKLNNTLNLTKMSVIIRNSLNHFKCFYMKHFCLIFKQCTKFQEVSPLQLEKKI